jgi:hypothetical protein
MLPKPGKEAQKETPPPETATSPPPQYRGTAPGYDFYLQSIVEIQRSVGGIEGSIKHLCERNKAHEAKLEGVSTEVHELAKEVHGAKKLAWAFGIVGSGIGALALLLLNKILDVVVAYFNAKLPGH